MKIHKPDGYIELGYGTDGFAPGVPVVGMHTNGPATEWYRVKWENGPLGEWQQCQDMRRHERVLAECADSATEFCGAATKVWVRQ